MPAFGMCGTVALDCVPPQAEVFRLSFDYTDYDSHSLTTLRKIVAAFDQRLRVEFEPLTITPRKMRTAQRRYARAS